MKVHERGVFSIKRYRTRVAVRLKEGYSDPEGETTMRSLKELGYPEVEEVRVSKVYDVILEASSLKEAEVKAVEISRRLLANPVKDDYEVRVEELE